MNKQKQQVVLVTGASSGMGKNFSEALLSQGYVVYAGARRLEQMQDLKSKGANTLSLDVTKEESIQAALTTIADNHGGVDVLINNAGFGLYGAVEDISIDEARYQFEVNVFGLGRLTQLCLPYMRSQRSGTIINISSMGGKVYTALGAWYHATKHALEGWSDCLRIELKLFGISVVIIEPGAIKTEFGDVMIGSMVERSGNGPYGKITRAVEALTKQEYEQGGGSDPKVITDLVVKAIRSDKPKTRYVAGKYARPLMFVRKWLGDRIYDRILLSMLKV